MVKADSQKHTGVDLSKEKSIQDNVVNRYRIDKKSLEICSISDIHLGNNRVSTYEMCERLREVFFPEMVLCDILFIVGDITDTALSLGDSDTTILLGFFIDLFRLAEEYDITIVMIRGTVSHDRDHLRALQVLHNRYGFKNSLYYSEKVGVEEIKEYGLKIAYFPDNLPYATSDEAIAVVKEQMHQRGWDHVDYALVHGYFKEVLPEGIPREPQCTFREEQFSFVTRAVMVGHVHTPAHFGHIYYHGSFDRLGHGEEEDKGFLRVTDANGDIKVRVVKNPYATPFITIDLSAYPSGEEAVVKYQERMKKLPLELRHHIRVKHPLAEVRIALSKFSAKHYPNVRFTHEASKKGKNDDTAVVIQDETLLASLTPPTEESLPDMILSFLTTHDDKSLTKERLAYHLNRLS